MAGTQRVCRVQAGERGRGEVTQGLMGWVKEFRLCSKTSGEALKGFKLERGQVYLLNRPLLTQRGK